MPYRYGYIPLSNRAHFVIDGGDAMAKVKGDELVKYIVERVVTHIETPKSVRKEQKLHEKRMRENWSTRWFGMLPLSFHLLKQQRKKRKKQTPTS